MLKNLLYTSTLIAGCLCAPSIKAQEPVFMANDKVCVYGLSDTGSYTFLYNNAIYTERWDTLAQTIFWRKVMRTAPDSGYLNVISGRQIISKLSTKNWNAMTDENKDFLRDSIKCKYNLTTDDKIVFTAGKSDFYKIEPVLNSIDKALKIFEQEQTDPFYAQAILLIESPGRMQKSTVGAYGPFQLMKSVAKCMGLKVNKGIDERKDFNRSAWAAAKLIRTICVPQTKYMLEKNNIKYSENDMWFKLLVLHVYHAGAGNVAPVIDKICPSEGNNELIQKMWVTSHGYFKNSSQNYSQLALASLVELNEHIFDKCNDYALNK